MYNMNKSVEKKDWSIENELNLIVDAKMDVLDALNKCTDQAMPNPMHVYHLSASVGMLEKAEQRAIENHEALQQRGMVVKPKCDLWGDADMQARQLFETLEKHYAGFWRCVAEYQKNPSEEVKMHMLQHFEHQLQAHDMLAMFVKGNCPVLCEEINVILTNWMAKKKAAMASHG